MTESTSHHQVYYVVDEPSGAVYASLLSEAAAMCAVFGFVLRSGEPLSDEGRNTVRNLKPWLLTDQISRVWPGTRLTHDVARVLAYRISPDSIHILKSSAAALYEWQHPRLPEDLFFLESPEGPAWLASIAHEREAFLDIASQEAARLQRAIPGLIIELGVTSWEPEDHHGSLTSASGELDPPSGS